MFESLMSNLRRVLLLQDKLDGIAKDIDEIQGDLKDHEKRLMRIELLIEMGFKAQSRGLPPE
jgi:hypothetical protein